MLKTLAYIIFLCTGVFALTLIVFFFRSQGVAVPSFGTGDVVAPADASRSALKKVLASYTFNRVSSRDIFGFSVFDLDVDVRASDRMRIYMFDHSYDVVRKNLSLLVPAFDLAETSDFFGKTLFLNDRNSKQIVRFLTEMDGQAVAFEVLQDEYPRLKGLLSE